MNNLSNLLWIETRKALRSGIPLFTVLGSMMMPLGIAFLIYLARNPELTKNLGIVSAKAGLAGFYATDWNTYLGFTCQIIAAGGFILATFVISWVFGREFVDGTLKDMLAVPIPRFTILLAKFIVVAVWSAVLTLVILLLSLAMGFLINLPGVSPAVLLRGCAGAAITACLAIATVLPFALIASLGRGYLLPLGLALLALVLANLVVIVGLGEYFPWAVPGLFASGEAVLTPVSFWIVAITGLAGIAATGLWWQRADQHR